MIQQRNTKQARTWDQDSDGNMVRKIDHKIELGTLY